MAELHEMFILMRCRLNDGFREPVGIYDCDKEEMFRIVQEHNGIHSGSDATWHYYACKKYYKNFGIQ